jgi:general secretion pathway protein M
MMKLDREQTIAVVVLFVIVASCVIAPLFFLKGRSDAAAALADASQMLQRLERGRMHSARKGGIHEQDAAPATAFLDAQTSGLASAQLESYISQLAARQQASLISSGIEQDEHSEAGETVRVRATLDIPYEKLQAFLFQIETGAPYVFIDSMTLQPASETAQPVTSASVMAVSLGVRALWHRSHM